MADDEHSVDRYLVNRVVAHQDTRAFGELVQRHQSQVRNFLRKLSRDPTLADDLAQDCFMHAWEKLHTYSGKGTVIGWLMKVAYTTFLQSKRRSRRYDEILDDVGQSSETSLDPSGGEEVTDLDRLLAVLSEEERAVMIMSYALGMSHREISDATTHPVGTIKSIIHRGKERIRDRFGIENRQHG
ncbi:MAG: sigma-70 family RNA polymerase sigma factor [Pseudomonadota bacterium]